MGVELKKTVVLVGMMGSGKTAVGTAVARHLGVPFVDQDDEIEAAANRTIAEIFRDHGEAFFREKETQVLGRLLDGPPCILSTGGGAFMSERNRDLIRDRGVSVWLNAELNLLWARVRYRNTRPLLQTDNPYQTLKTLYDLRCPIYAGAQLHVMSRSNYSIEDMATTVVKTLSQHPEILKVSQNVRD
ncbi:shikimate kinase [Pseudoruegeria sp. SK021]|uniref:shikimate kinase n=1 Tax=Pseudoruegeria sp. SK021 TaxID=1933035 RepID=UPI000A21826C|nr:shikimate kinase [Pseudoruegeria sp. SK021]OSP55455.1 shikimate kinase [Pseudoruegeria sp. SK021]